MNTPIYKNKKFQILSISVCLLLFGCSKQAEEEEVSSSPNYNEGYWQNDNNANEGNDDDDNGNWGFSAEMSFSELGSIKQKVILGNSSCNSDELKFRWPMNGNQSSDWAIAQYYDLDYSSGKADYFGGYDEEAKTYDQHKGTDVVVASFRDMDSNTGVYAAAAGKVIAMKESGFDRSYGAVNNNCNANSNYVVIQHSNGFTSSYVHLKKNSVPVNVGDQVTEGQRIGYVGSSGCSTHPHLHFEVRNCQDEQLDPFDLAMWKNGQRPSYHAPLKIMDIFLKEGAFTTAQIVDPAPNITKIKKNRTLGIAMAIAGVTDGDKITVQVTKPGGTATSSWTRTYGKAWTFSLLKTSVSIDEVTGYWNVRFLRNGVHTHTYIFEVIN